MTKKVQMTRNLGVGLDEVNTKRIWVAQHVLVVSL